MTTKIQADYAISPLEAADVQSVFSCGQHDLDRYFAKHALANDTAGVGRTYVVRHRREVAIAEPKVAGFYTLSMAQTDSSDVANATGKHLPKYPMPVALIGRLAIDKRVQGQGFGEQLLMDAIARVVDASSLLGCTGIVVDAKR